jgi:hypothetical protein
MKDSVKTGLNRTGIQMAPKLSKEMIEADPTLAVLSSNSDISIDELREMYIRESGDLGTVPIPGSVKGAVTTGLKKLQGKDPEVLIDKLGERLAFERTGARLYDALITKCEATLPNVSVKPLREFREEEVEHFRLVWNAMEAIGADPTAQTPCADASGVASMGLMQVLTDPRTSVPQCVEAILIAELADNDGWELLITLARNAGLDDVAQQFEVARANEAKHLAHIREWLKSLVIKNEGVSIQ